MCQIDGRCQCVKEFEVVRTLMVWLSMMTVRERRGERERGRERDVQVSVSEEHGQPGGSSASM